MNIKLTLQEIIDKLSEQSGQSKKISENFLRILIDVIEEGLKKDGIAKVKGLGTFKIISIEQRKSVNVQDGSEYIIPAHNKISFTPEKTIKEEINRPYSHLETYTLSDDAPVMVTPDDEDDDNLIETSNDDKEENSSVEEFIPSIEEESKEIKNSTAAEEKIESSSENILEKEENKLGVETKESTQIVEEIFHEEKTFIKETINDNIMEEKKDNIELAEEINNDVTDEANEMSTNENEVKEVNEFLTIANKVPNLGQFLYNFDFFLQNGLMTQDQYLEIDKIINADMRKVNVHLKPLINIYYNTAWELNKTLIDAISYLEQLNAVYANVKKR